MCLLLGVKHTHTVSSQGLPVAGNESKTPGSKAPGPQNKKDSQETLNSLCFTLHKAFSVSVNIIMLMISAKYKIFIMRWKERFYCTMKVFKSINIDKSFSSSEIKLKMRLMGTLTRSFKHD